MPHSNAQSILWLLQTTTYMTFKQYLGLELSDTSSQCIVDIKLIWHSCCFSIRHTSHRLTLRHLFLYRLLSVFTCIHTSLPSLFRVMVTPVHLMPFFPIAVIIDDAWHDRMGTHREGTFCPRQSNILICCSPAKMLHLGMHRR